MSNLLFPSTLPGVDIKVRREPVSNTKTQTAQAGREFRYTWETYPRYRYTLDFNLLRAAAAYGEFQRLFGMLGRHFGALDSFLFQDPQDQSVIDHGFAAPDGATTQFQLQRTLQSIVADASGYLYNQATKPYTNLVKNSSFEFDANADGLADSWIIYNPESTTVPAFATIVPGMNGGKAQRISWGTNATAGKGITQQPIGSTPLAGQWHTLSVFARASGTNIGKFLGLSWAVVPSQVLVIACPALSGNWQRYVFQIFWNTNLSPSGNIFITIANTASGAFSAPNTFGDLDFDLAQVTTGQWGANDLQPIETSATAGAARTPVYWPNGLGDGYEPIFELNGAPTIYQDGDWMGRRQLYPWARTNLLPFSQALDSWASKTGVAISANTTVAPDGTTTAETFTEDNPSSAPTLNTLTPSTTGGTIASGTVFVKVAALNGTVEGLPSNELSVAVTGPSASIVAAWSAPGSGPAPTGYRIYVGTAAGAEGQVFIAGNVLTVTITTLTGSAATPLATTAVEHRIQDQTVPVEAVGELRCYSAFVKANTLANIDFYVNGDGNRGLNFNLGTGLIDAITGGLGAPLASGVQTSPLWPGWYRIWFVKRVGVAGSSGLRIQGTDATYTIAYTGTGRSFSAWGAMCERTSNLNGPTPYIPTPSTTAVTVTDYALSGSVATLTAPPPAGSVLSWDGNYYRRVRFAADNLPADQLALTMWEAKQVQLISVKP